MTVFTWLAGQHSLIGAFPRNPLGLPSRNTSTRKPLVLLWSEQYSPVPELSLVTPQEPCSRLVTGLVWGLGNTSSHTAWHTDNGSPTY